VHTLRTSLRRLSLGLGSAFALSLACSSEDPQSPPPAGVGGSAAPTGGSSTGGAPPVTGGISAGGTTGGAVTATGGTTGGAPTTSGGAPAVTGGAPQAGGGAGSGGTPAAGGAGAPGGTGAGGTAAGAAGAAGAPSGGSGGGSSATGFLVENFDSQTAGKQPTGWDNFVAWNKNGMNPSGDTLALVDDSKAHSGKNSMHFHGGANPAMITKALPTGTNKLYVRGWFFMSRSLGATASTSANHETLIGIRGESGSASNEVRFGEIKGALGTNEVPSDNISPKMDLWNKGPTIPGNTWVCIEVAFIGDKTPNELHAWHNGTEVHSITAGNQWQNGTMPDTWLNGKFVEVILGWHSFSSSTADIWLDDLVLSTSPIGCD
jgi:hypothetical protein